jgi:hypothetical protein
MANEWTKVELYGQNNDGDPRRYTVASGVAIAKGTLLQLTDPRTASAHSAALQPIAGVAAMSKSATDLSTSISAWTNGIFEVTCSGAIPVGMGVSAGTAANIVAVAVNASAASGTIICGHALETAEEGEAINVRLLV